MVYSIHTVVSVEHNKYEMTTTHWRKVLKIEAHSLWHLVNEHHRMILIISTETEDHAMIADCFRESCKSFFITKDMILMIECLFIQHTGGQ